MCLKSYPNSDTKLYCFPSRSQLIYLTGDTNLNLLIENAIFFVLASSFLAIAGWMWRNTKPYSLPEPLPSWLKIWFGTVAILAGVLPIVALVL